jgi:hypothetical protein
VDPNRVGVVCRFGGIDADVMLSQRVGRTVVRVGTAGGWLGARLRGGRRMLHPAGRSYRGSLEVVGGLASGVPLLDEPGRYRATVRLSKGAPTPRGWPDVLGLAVRVHDVDGRDVDLLLSSSTRLPLLRQVFLPRRRIAGPYSSLAGYETPRGRRYLAAWGPAGAGLGTRLDDVASAMWLGDARFVLAVATRSGRWHRWGELRLEEPLSPRDDADLAFDPAGNDLPELRAAGLLQLVRGATYRGSQRGRNVTPRAHAPAVPTAPGSDYSAL